MTFPTARSHIIRNEEGEVLGWEPYPDDSPEDYLDDYNNDDREPPEPKDTAQCIQWGIHALDGDGIEGEDDVYECCYCQGRFIDKDGTITNL